MIEIIVARSTNGVIGRSGQLPWHLPTDLRRFRTLTRGRAVVMGRKTFESIPTTVRPLPDRRNLVLTSDPTYAPRGAEVFGGLEAALDACDRDCFVMGGSRVYAYALQHASRVHLTHVETRCEGDAYFPALPATDWRCVEESDRMVENGCEFVFRVYEREA